MRGDGSPGRRRAPLPESIWEESHSEEGRDVRAALRERGLVERLGVEQALEEGRTGEVAEQRAVPGEEQLLGIVATERARVHFALEVPDSEIPHRTEDRGQIEPDVRA